MRAAARVLVLLGLVSCAPAYNKSPAPYNKSPAPSAPSRYQNRLYPERNLESDQADCEIPANLRAAVAMQELTASGQSGLRGILAMADIQARKAREIRRCMLELGWEQVR